MATTTTNFGWDIPQSTDLVKDGATAIAALGQDIDTALVDLKGGTTGQVLAKASGTDLDFSWVAQDDSNAIQNAIVDAKGDLISATAADTPARLAVGTNGQILAADSTEATGLKWINASAGALALVKTQTIGTAVSSVTVSDAFSATYDNYLITVSGGSASTTQDLQMTLGSTSAGYYWAAGRFFPAGGSSGMTSGNNTSSFRVTTHNADNVATKIDIQQPFLSKKTVFQSSSQTTGEINLYQGMLDNSTSYTAFTLTPAGGTLTGGTIRVYGYQNS